MSKHPLRPLRHYVYAYLLLALDMLLLVQLWQWQ